MAADQSGLRIRNASLVNGRRVEAWVIDGECLWERPERLSGEVEEFDARGAVIVPGLNDHHIHVLAASAALDSVSCASAVVGDRAGLESALRQARPRDDGWIRAVDFQPEDLGELDLETLDAWVPNRPLRVQHASGRLWYFNSAGVRALGTDAPWAGPGRLFDADSWLRSHGRQILPDVARLSEQLAGLGVVGLTDTGPGNDASTVDLFRREQCTGRLRQQLLLMGNDSLNGIYRAGSAESLRIGALKIHLLESALPDFEQTVERVRACHEVSRPAAFHCVTRVELVFALAVINEAGALEGDRIEHLGMSLAEDLVELRKLGLRVVSQPGFLRSKGERYLRGVPEAQWPELYRLESVVRAKVPLAGSSDAPHGPLSPWVAMQAACDRSSAAGSVLSPAEALTPEQALAMYTADLWLPQLGSLVPRAGQHSSFCLLDRSWSEAREQLSAVQPCLTWSRGRLIWSSKAVTPYG